MNVAACPECEAQVVQCDNNVYLDYPAVPYDGDRLGATWTLMPLGGMMLATNGDAPLTGMAHTLHEHQPPESVLA